MWEFRLQEFPIKRLLPNSHFKWSEMRVLFIFLFVITVTWALKCYVGPNEETDRPSLQKCPRGSECCSHNTSPRKWFSCESVRCPNFGGKSEVVYDGTDGSKLYFCKRAEGNCRFWQWRASNSD
ncbi:hypothetical protein PRIPAC_91043 [Pristionchus pacificus]|uniref:Uncharacterized protein n=1 Tax=Pristionchus pacificus TaxID=54126 RepID=A0A2A6B7Y4_PRIPA|nr:hypothetical protein PRIPAC_91043 [Pristionchus pacificus]|eukprot:PDM61975.1 hypothetical protein PRIPAC_51417 [Pristionchus pacificus]